jgi:hypothetical protein
MSENSTEDDTPDTVSMTIERDHLDYARQVAAEHGVTLETEDGFVDPVTIGLALMGGAMAVAAVHEIIERHRGGQIIDLQPGADPIARRDNKLQYGLVILIAADGQVELKTYEGKGMFQQVVDSLANMIPSLTGQPAGAVQQSAQSALGHLAAVTTTS